MASIETLGLYDDGESFCHICGMETEFSPIHGMRYCNNCERCADKDIVLGIEIYYKLGTVAVRDYIDSEIPDSTYRYRDTLFILHHWTGTPFGVDYICTVR